MPRKGQNLQPFTGNGDVTHVSEKSFSETETHKKKEHKTCTVFGTYIGTFDAIKNILLFFILISGIKVRARDFTNEIYSLNG